MRKYNRSEIMKKAWAVAKARGVAFADALRRAWADAKAIARALAVVGEAKTWYGWKERGFEVIHGSKAIFQITVADPKTKNGERVISFFTRAQVAVPALAE